MLVFILNYKVLRRHNSLPKMQVQGEIKGFFIVRALIGSMKRGAMIREAALRADMNLINCMISTVILYSGYFIRHNTGMFLNPELIGHA